MEIWRVGEILGEIHMEIEGMFFSFEMNWDFTCQEDHRISKGELALLNACNWKFLSTLRWLLTTGYFPQDNSNQNWETEAKIHTGPLSDFKDLCYVYWFIIHIYIYICVNIKMNTGIYTVFYKECIFLCIVIFNR